MLGRTRGGDSAMIRQLLVTEQKGNIANVLETGTEWPQSLIHLITAITI